MSKSKAKSTSSTLSYTFGKIPDTAMAKSQIYALSDLLSSNSSEVLFDREKGARSIKNLQKRWRDCVSDFNRNNWSKLSGAGYMTHRNCPPPFATTKDFVRPCRDYVVCPFCWSRNVVRDTFNRVAWSLYGVEDAEQATRVRGDLAVLDAIKTNHLPQSKPLSELIQKCQNTISKIRDVLGDHATGTYTLATIEPANGEWLLTRRSLSVVRADRDYSEFLSKNDETMRVKLTKAPVKPRQLAGIIGRVCQYPAGLILEDPAHAVSVLNARSGSRGKAPRLSAVFGDLRNESARKRAQTEKWESLDEND